VLRILSSEKRVFRIIEKAYPLKRRVNKFIVKKA